MRQQAIEKLAMKIVFAVRAIPFTDDAVFSPEYQLARTLCTKMEILLDRTDENRAASVIREIMNGEL